MEQGSGGCVDSIRSRSSKEGFKGVARCIVQHQAIGSLARRGGAW